MPVEIVRETNDLLVVKDESFTQAEDELGASYFILLRDFPLNGHFLRPAHVEVLGTLVAPYLRRPAGFAEIYGMTDRTGNRETNYIVGAARVAAVQQGLVKFGTPRSKYDHAFTKSIGEDFFEDRHNRKPEEKAFDDGRLDENFRLVVVALSPAPIGIPTRLFRFRPAADTLGFCRPHEERK